MRAFSCGPHVGRTVRVDRPPVAPESTDRHEKSGRADALRQAPEGLYGGGVRAECGVVQPAAHAWRDGSRRLAEQGLLLFVSAIKLLAEIALMALAGQFVLGLLAGAKRDGNFFYRTLRSSPGRPARACAGSRRAPSSIATFRSPRSCCWPRPGWSRPWPRSTSACASESNCAADAHRLPYLRLKLRAMGLLMLGRRAAPSRVRRHAARAGRTMPTRSPAAPTCMRRRAPASSRSPMPSGWSQRIPTASAADWFNLAFLRDGRPTGTRRRSRLPARRWRSTPSSTAPGTAWACR